MNKSFREIFEEAEPRNFLKKSIDESRAVDSMEFASQLGHPKYQNLSFDAGVADEAVVLFLDIRGFTRLSLELPNDELVRILQRLTIASVLTIRQFGGYVGE